jgi:hypothetical protein
MEAVQVWDPGPPGAALTAPRYGVTSPRCPFGRCLAVRLGDCFTTWEAALRAAGSSNASASSCLGVGIRPERTRITTSASFDASLPPMKRDAGRFTVLDPAPAADLRSTLRAAVSIATLLA